MPSDLDIDTLWLSALRSAGRSPKTLSTYAYCVEQLKAWRPGQLETLSRFEALAFVKHLGDQYTPGGVSLRVRSLRALWSWALAEEMVESNVFARIKVSVTPEAKPTASAEQIEAMLTHARGNRRDYALLTLLVDSGCRRKEIASLTVSDIDLSSGVVRFPVSKSMIRTVPLSDRCVTALGRWLRYRGMGGGSLWSCADPYSLVNAACLRHSRNTLRAHAMRRAFAVAWIAKGGSETGLMRIAGWTSREMIAIYTRANADVLAADEFRRLLG